MKFEPIASSPLWQRAMPPGPDVRVKITEEYAKLVGRDAYFWAWPLAGVYNRRLGADANTEIAYAGPLPAAPVNRLAMLTDYAPPRSTWSRARTRMSCTAADPWRSSGPRLSCRSPTSGTGSGCTRSPIRAPTASSNSEGWTRTTPGFYLLVGPNWQGEVPPGITAVFRSPTDTGFVAPRIFMDDTGEDRRVIQGVLQSILMYPLDEYDGRMKRIDWSTIPRLPNPATGEEEVKWVVPEKIFDELAAILADAPPLPGEEARYAQVLAVLDAATGDKAIKQAMIDGAKEADELLVKPLLQFRNYGQQLPHHWSTISNESAFGTDYFTRTAVARSNIFVNSPNETKYFYQDLDVDGTRLNGAHRYTVTFREGQTPVHGLWSLTLYNEHHFFAPNAINRYSLGTKNKDLLQNPDGSLTIQARADEPDQRTNWLPAPAGQDFSLYVRAYWPGRRWRSPTVRGLRRPRSR